MISSSKTSEAQRLYDAAIDCFADGNLAGAIESFRACLGVDPKFLDAMHGLIRALQDAGEIDEAIVLAQRLIAIDPDDVLPHTSLSILYQRKGMIPEAEAEATRAKVLGWKKELREQKKSSV